MLKFLHQILCLFLQLYVQNRTAKRILAPYLHFEREMFHVQTNTQTRILYYARFVPVVSSYQYAVLRGKKLTTQEAEAVTLLAAASPLYDDAFDKQYLSQETLKALVLGELSKEKLHPETFLLHDFCAQLRLLLPETKKTFYEVHEKLWQAQRLVPQTEAEAYQAMKEKGAASTLLFRTLLQGDISDTERQLIELQGELIQWTDDIFDVYEDVKENHISIFTSSKVNWTEVEKNFEQSYKKMINLCRSLAYPERGKKRFLSIQALFFGRAWVCLQQHKQLAELKKAWQPASFTRSELICDMEKWKNLKAWYQAFRKLEAWAE